MKSKEQIEQRIKELQDIDDMEKAKDPNWNPGDRGFVFRRMELRWVLEDEEDE